MTRPGTKWRGALARHGDAVDSYASAAASVPASAWLVPRQPGKWSPAEITQHLILGFDAVERELRGGAAMQLRLGKWQRAVARLIYMRRILRDGEFPRGARSPREARPGGALLEQDAAIVAFRTRASELEQLLAQLHDTHPGTRITHPYFGSISLEQAVFISARHIEHHRVDLAPAVVT